MHTPDISQANDYRDKAHPAGNQEFRDNSYPKKKIPQKRITKNPTRKSDLSSQKMHACNAKQYKQIKRRMVKKQNQQEVKLEQKDQDVVRFVTEVERLQRTIHTCTFELRETQRKEALSVYSCNTQNGSDVTSRECGIEGFSIRVVRLKKGERTAKKTDPGAGVPLQE